jgi:hypothetical protein
MPQKEEKKEKNNVNIGPLNIIETVITTTTVPVAAPVAAAPAFPVGMAAPVVYQQ